MPRLTLTLILTLTLTLTSGHDGEKKWPVLQGDDQMWCDQTLAEAWDDIANYSFFTFVREPVNRFKSGAPAPS